MYDKELTAKDKAYLVMEFFRLMHEKEEFMMIQRLIKRAMETIQDSEVFPLLEDISIHEFITVCDDIALLKTPKLDYILNGIKDKVTPEWIKEVKRVVEIAKSKAEI